MYSSHRDIPTEGGMSNQKVFINDDDNAYDYVDDE
jgi:hypothetical protein